jgi:hypothetical protein
MYDVVFKRLMENERVARFFLSTMLNQNVVDVLFHPQEFTYKKDPPQDEKVLCVSIFRVDFVATILSDNGERKKVLVEVQKSNEEDDVLRFRKYLARQYAKVDIINGERFILPITTIYLLGFKLEGINTPCAKVERSYIDMVSGKRIEAKNYFMEQLTHDSYVVQTEFISDRFQTRLDQLLSIFEQKNYFSDNIKYLKFYNYDPEDNEIRAITDILQKIGANKEDRERLEIEEEAHRIEAARYKAHFGEIESAKKKLEASLKEKEEVIAENEEALAAKDEALEKQRQTILNYAKYLLSTGKSAEEIIAETGLNKEEIPL